MKNTLKTEFKEARDIVESEALATTLVSEVQLAFVPVYFPGEPVSVLAAGQRLPEYNVLRGTVSPGVQCDLPGPRNAVPYLGPARAPVRADQP